MMKFKEMFDIQTTFTIVNPVKISGLSINPDWCRISLKFTALMVKLLDKILALLLVYSNISTEIVAYKV